MLVLIGATYSYTRRVGLNALSQDALPSHRASLKRREEPGAFERSGDPALSSIPRRALLIVGVRVMRSTKDMVAAVNKKGPRLVKTGPNQENATPSGYAKAERWVGPPPSPGRTSGQSYM